jgi:energy-coupling factor transport system ATP-binding protein
LSAIISIENLSYAYPQTDPDSEPVWVLDGVDLRVSAGEFVAIMGPTGGGKTTLCLALNGIVPHSTGGVIGGNLYVGGHNSKDRTVAQLAQTVGLVFQGPETQLFNMTVEAEVAFGLETLGLPPPEIRSRIDWALKLVGMDGQLHRSPFELSGGQKQRVAIAAILALKPPVLVLDEPTANLDPMGKREVFAAVDSLRRQEGITVILVSHESEQIAEFAERVIVLSEGRVTSDTSPRNTFSPAGKLRDVGLSVPQVSQLAQCLNAQLGTQYAFTRLDEAYQVLSQTAFQVEPKQDEKPDSCEGATGARSTLFRIHNLSYNYANQKNALIDVSLEFYSGEFVAILGQNGAGKTTLVKHLNGLLRPTHGRVLLCDKEVADRSIADLAKTVGFVFQNPDHMIFSASVREELAAGPRYLGLADDVINQRVETALERFGLSHHSEQQPAQLSFGLRRKVSVAAVVAMETDVLIVDEPTSGLDQRSSDEIMTILEQINREGRTVILITHDTELAVRYVPRTILMCDGRILADGSTRHIFEQRELLQRTQIESLQITRLGERLGFGHSQLSVSELCRRLT